MAMPLGDWATWVASAGTVAAVSVALFQAHQVRLSENRQKQVEASDRHKASLEERRAQAESVSAWVSRYMTDDYENDVMTPVEVELSNSSNQLVYEVVVFQVFTQNSLEGPHRGEEWRLLRAYQPIQEHGYVVIGALQPGRSSVVMPQMYDPSGGRIGIEFAFTDRSGRHWLRRHNGPLESLEEGAVEHYQLIRPITYIAASSQP